MKTLKIQIFTILLIILTSNAFSQELYVESHLSGVKADLSDQKKGTEMKMTFYFKEKYIEYFVKNESKELLMETILLITDFEEKTSSGEDTTYDLKVAFEDGEYLGKLSITLVKDDDEDIMVGCLEGLYFTGKYKVL